MIIADKFVYVHMPKTGGTFVTGMLSKIHEAHPELYGAIREAGKKHDRCSSIPDRERHKPILGCVRCPYDWYVSEYEFGWWKRDSQRKSFAKAPDFHRYADFPDISFADWLPLHDAAYPTGPDDIRDQYGFVTRRFVYFYFRDPDAALSQLNAEYVSSGRYRENMCNVHFVRTSSLNEDLYQWLLANGYQPEHIELVRSAGKLLPEGSVRQESQSWDKYFTPELKAYVREKDWPLFALFPEFDV